MSGRLEQAFSGRVTRFHDGEIQIAGGYEKLRKRLRLACQKAPRILRKVNEGAIAEDSASILTIGRGRTKVTLGLSDSIQFTWSDAWHGEIFHGDGTLEFIGGGIKPEGRSGCILLSPGGAAHISRLNAPVAELAPLRLIMDALPKLEETVNGESHWPDGLAGTQMAEDLLDEFAEPALALLLEVGRGNGQFFKNLGDQIARVRPKHKQRRQSHERESPTTSIRPPLRDDEGLLETILTQLTEETLECPEIDEVTRRFNAEIIKPPSGAVGAEVAPRLPVERRTVQKRLVEMGFEWIAFPSGH